MLCVTTAPETSVTFVEPPEHFGLHLKGTSGRDVFIDSIDEDSEADDFAGLRPGLLLKQLDGQSVEEMEIGAILAQVNDGKRPKQMLFAIHQARQAKNKLKLAVKLGESRTRVVEKASTIMRLTNDARAQVWGLDRPPSRQ